jgi:hypothetical protein
MTEAKPKTTFHFPRTPLLVEIERHCGFPDCTALNRIGLTNQEAIEYRGFECFRCERWNNDSVSQLELPESWTKADELSHYFPFALNRDQSTF